MNTGIRTPNLERLAFLPELTTKLHSHVSPKLPMKRTIVTLSLALTFPLALLAEGAPDNGNGQGPGPGPGGPGGHHKHQGPGNGPGQGKDDGNGPGAGGKGGCQKGQKGNKPAENN